MSKNEKADTALIIEGLEFVTAGVQQKWVPLGIRVNPDGPEFEALVNLVAVRKYKRTQARNERKKAQLGTNPAQARLDALDLELEEQLHDLLLADWRGSTLANIVSILRGGKAFNPDSPAFAAMMKSNTSLPFDGVIKVENGEPIRLSRYLYSNAWPSKFANIIVNAVVEAGASEEDAADEGKDDSED